jgi:4-amino-4-deoxy-L-arabinose transferase-like glycosyltransferase
MFNLLISRHYFHVKLSPDENLYNTISHAVLNGNNFCQTGDQKIDIGQEVTPFYPIIVTGAYLFRDSIKSPVFLNIILNCLTIVLLFLIMNLVTKSRLISSVLAFGFIFYFPLWAYNYYLMMEITTVFFFILTLYLFTEYYYSFKLKYLYFSTLSFSLLSLINNRFIVLLFIFILFLFIVSLFREKSIIKTFFIPVLIVLLTISPWFVRQYLVYDQFVFFTPLWNNVVADNVGLLKRIDLTTNADARSEAKSFPLKFEEYCKSLEIYNSEKVQTRGATAFTVDKYNEIIKKHNKSENIYIARLKKYFTLYYRNFQFTSPTDFRLIVPSGKQFKIVQLFILLPLFVFSIMGLAVGVYKRELLVILLGTLFFAHVLLHVYIHFIDRYRLTIIPVLVIITAYFFGEFFLLLKKGSFQKLFRGELKAL